MADLPSESPRRPLTEEDLLACLLDDDNSVILGLSDDEDQNDEHIPDPSVSYSKDFNLTEILMNSSDIEEDNPVDKNEEVQENAVLQQENEETVEAEVDDDQENQKRKRKKFFDSLNFTNTKNIN